VSIWVSPKPMKREVVSIAIYYAWKESDDRIIKSKSTSGLVLIFMSNMLN